MSNIVSLTVNASTTKGSGHKNIHSTKSERLICVVTKAMAHTGASDVTKTSEWVALIKEEA